MIEPQDYHHFVFLMHHCTLLVTDSGSIQEEITFLGKPTLVIRSTTERVDALQAGNTMSSPTRPRAARAVYFDIAVGSRLL